MTFILDAGRLGDKEEAHAYLKEVFGLPDYYGGNLDALYDCLSEIQELEIIVEHTGESGPYYKRLRTVLRDASMYFEEIRTTLENAAPLNRGRSETEQQM